MSDLPSRLRSAWRGGPARAARLALGVALLGVAVYYATRGVDPAQLGAAAWWQWAAIAAGVLVNLAMTTAIFQLVNRGFRPEPAVPWRTMTRLIAASTLLNYVPLLRLGLWSRAAYLKTHHGVDIKSTAIALGLVVWMSFLVVVCCAYLLIKAGSAVAWILSGLLFIAIGMGMTTHCAVRWKMHWRNTSGWLWPAIRVVDVLASGLRLWIALQVVGIDIAWHEAVLLGCATTLGRLAAVTPNGLGVSEWLVAFVGTSRAMADPVPVAALAAAAVIDRAVEVCVIVPVGAWGAAVFRKPNPAGAPPDPRKVV